MTASSTADPLKRGPAAFAEVTASQGERAGRLQQGRRWNTQNVQHVTAASTKGNFHLAIRRRSRYHLQTEVSK